MCIRDRHIGDHAPIEWIRIERKSLTLEQLGDQRRRIVAQRLEHQSLLMRFGMVDAEQQFGIGRGREEQLRTAGPAILIVDVAVEEDVELISVAEIADQRDLCACLLYTSRCV